MWDRPNGDFYPGTMNIGVPMDKTIRKFTSHEEMRAETYRYWRTRPDGEVFDAIAEMSAEAYAEYYKLKGIVPHVEGPPRSLTRIQRLPR